MGHAEAPVMICDLLNHEEVIATAHLAEEGGPLNWVLIDAHIPFPAKGGAVKVPRVRGLATGMGGVMIVASAEKIPGNSVSFLITFATGRREFVFV